MNYVTSSPVLLIVFNRPEQTSQLIDALRNVKPRCIYVAADGPRAGVPGEPERCAAVLASLTSIDWPCTIAVRVNEINQGSALMIPSAVDWFFDSVDSGIVLEDDCIPCTDFFVFCDAMLQKYEDDCRVAWINGSNAGYIPSTAIKSDFSFSNYAISWGWASWRRSWKTTFPPSVVRDDASASLRLDLKSIPIKGLMCRIFWRQNIKYAFSINNWDFRFDYYMWRNGAMAITPHVNLISNIGYGIEAVHGGRRDDPRGNIATGFMNARMSPPVGMGVNFDLDSYLERNFFRVGIVNILKLTIARNFPLIRNVYRKKLKKIN